MTTMIKQFLLAAFAALTLTAASSAQQFVAYAYMYNQSIGLADGSIQAGPILSFEAGGYHTPTGGPSSINEALAREADVVDAIQVNIEPYCNDVLTQELSAIVNAIRLAENGGPGVEFGILDPGCPDSYRDQAGWCAATVRKNLDRFLNGYDREWVDGGWVDVWGPKRRMPQPFGFGPDGEPSPSFNDFIEILAKRYCPVGADNDPDNLNQHWVTNVTNFYQLHGLAQPAGAFCAKK